MILNSLLFLASVTVPDPNVTVNLNIPPQYMGDTIVIISTEDQKAINKDCGKAEKNYVTLACADVTIIYMPNPCFYPEEKNHDSYAHLLCHELAHINGWHHKNE